MAIAFVQRKSNGAANAGPFDIVLTSGATAGNLLLAFHVDADTTDNVMPAISGFTDVGTSEQYANGTNDCNSKAWYKYATGGETTITFPDTGGGTNDGVSGCVMEFSGVAAAVDGGPFSTAATKATGTASAHADPPQIATAANDAVVIMGGAAHATAGVTFTAPTNYTTNAEPGTAGTDTISSGAGMAYRLSGYANPENPGAFTASATAAGDSWNAVTLALKAATAAAQNLTGSLYQNTPTFFTGALVKDQPLDGTLFQKAPTFFTGTIAAVAPQDLTGILFQKAPTFFTETVIQNVAAGFLQVAPTFPTHSISIAGAEAPAGGGGRFRHSRMAFNRSFRHSGHGPRRLSPKPRPRHR